MIYLHLFRLSENVPDVYTVESRDFQLLCNSFDIIQNSIRNSADSMCLLSDTSSCPDTLLPYLQTKLGFFTKQKIDSDKLRILLQAFPHIVKSKGSRQGIILAIRAFLKCIHKAEIVQLDIHNESDNSDSTDYFIDIGMNGQITDISILQELLDYVIPAGYVVQYYFFKDAEYVSRIRPSNCIRIFFVRSNGIDSGNSIPQERNTEGTSVFKLPNLETLVTDYEISSNEKHFNSVGGTRLVGGNEYEHN